MNRPLLITPEKAAVIMSVLAGRIGINAPDASRFEGDNIERDENGNIVTTVNRWGDRVPKTKPYNVKDGVAVITVTGSLVNRGAWIGANSGLTSYEGIGHQLKTALADDAVKSVILDLHSPGGEAVGAFETAALVRSLAAKKRTVALVNGMAASAAYAIASGASEIVTTETGVAGSIGVVLLHADYSESLASEGIKPTLIFAGAHKVDGNPFEPLSDAVKADLQAEVTAFYEKFLATVETGRGARTTREMARSTEARTFIGEAAVAAGLADRVGTFESVLAELSLPARLTGRTTPVSAKGAIMSETNITPAAETPPGISQAAHDAAVRDAEARGASNERARISAIVGHDNIRGSATRIGAAIALATKAPSMSADEVVAFVSENVAEASSTAAFEAQAAANPANAVAGTPGAGNPPTGRERGAAIAARFKSIAGK